MATQTFPPRTDGVTKTLLCALNWYFVLFWKEIQLWQPYCSQIPSCCIDFMEPGPDYKDFCEGAVLMEFSDAFKMPWSCLNCWVQCIPRMSLSPIFLMICSVTWYRVSSTALASPSCTLCSSPVLLMKDVCQVATLEETGIFALL